LGLQEQPAAWRSRDGDGHVSRQPRIRLDRVAIVDRINHDLQQFRLVGDLVQVDDFDAAERLAVVVDERAALPAVGGLWSQEASWVSPSQSKRVGVERGWPAAGPRGSAFLPKVADRPVADNWA
jgi:hypothetical protein